LPELLRRAGASEHRVEEALTLLWPLGRDDLRAPSGFLTHPIRVMQELGKYRGSGHAAKTLVACAERLLAGPEADAPVSPLTLVEGLLSREGTELIQEGLGFQPLHYHLVAPAVEAVRKRLFVLLGRQARDGSRRNRALAAHLLGEALDQPRGAFGQSVPKEVFDQWLPEQLRLLGQIQGLMTEPAAPLVRSRLRSVTQWHADHSAWPDARQAARRIVAIAEVGDEQLMTAVVRPYDFHRDRRDDERRIKAVARRLANDPSDLADILDAHLTEAAEAGAEPNPRPLLLTLAAVAPTCIDALTTTLLNEPDRPAAAYLDTCLLALGRAAPDRLAAILDRLDAGAVTVRRGLAGYLSDLDWNDGDRSSEFLLLSRLVIDEDRAVRSSAMHAVLRSRTADPRRAADVALNARLDRDGKFAALMSLTLSEPGCRLDAVQVKRALSKLLEVDELEHATVQFLALVGERDPQAVLDLLIARLGRNPGRAAYEAVPWHRFDADLLAAADADAYAESLRRVRRAALSEDSAVRYNAPRLFWHLDRDVDLSLCVLHEWLISGDHAKVSAAAQLLEGIVPGRSRRQDEDEGWRELLDRPWFVIDVLGRCIDEPTEIREAIWAGFRRVLFSNEINRTIGEPDERTDLTCQLAERMAAALPAGAAARAFFEELGHYSRASLEAERVEDDEFPHRLR
jgi:hypothetical protein